jgi:hypothetical protein
MFTALHRALDLPSGPITSEMLYQAVEQKVPEQADLDWKRKLPKQPFLEEWGAEFAKDVAAMANSGGGLIVYGVGDKDGCACARHDVGAVPEQLEANLRSIARSQIAPPVFNLEISRVEAEGARALAVYVPRDGAVPHLVYRKKDSDFHFAAPARDGAHTHYLTERQIEQMYRARFGEQVDTTEALNALYAGATAGLPTEELAWMIGVVRPQSSGSDAPRRTREQAVAILEDALKKSPLVIKDQGRSHSRLNELAEGELYPGLRSWKSHALRRQDRMTWARASAELHDDGATCLASAVGATAFGSSVAESGWQVSAQRIEGFVAALGCLAHANNASLGVRECDVLVGLEWAGDEPIVLRRPHVGWGYRDAESGPVHAYRRISTRWAVGADTALMRQQVRDLALDAVNQGGIWYLSALTEPGTPETRV